MAQKEGLPAGRISAMVVDEDKCHADSTSCMLSAELNFCVTVFTSPIKALDFLQNHAEDVGLVLADVHMEEMNGFEFLKAARALRKSIQVIMMSTETTMYAMKRCVQLGARFLVKKPLDAGTVQNLWQHLDLKVLRREKIKDLLQDESVGDKSTCAGEMNSVAENQKDDTKKKFHLMWTPHLQKKFLHALEILGEDASPKKIKMIMDVENIDCRQIGTHLQKHRQQLKKKFNKTSFAKGSSEGASNSGIEPAMSFHTRRSATLQPRSYATQPEETTMQTHPEDDERDDIYVAMRRALQDGTIFDESKYPSCDPCGHEDQDEYVVGGDANAIDSSGDDHQVAVAAAAVVSAPCNEDASQEMMNTTASDDATRESKAPVFRLVDYSDSESD